MSQSPDQNSENLQPDVNSSVEHQAEGFLVDGDMSVVQGDGNRAIQGDNNRAVLGDNNQVVQGDGNWVGNTWNFFFSWGSKSLTPDQRNHNRRILLNKVKKDWIENEGDAVLEKSLPKPKKESIVLSLETRPDALTNSWHDIKETGEDSRKTLPEGTKVIDIFEKFGAGRTLLILGGPGSGKTTKLLELTRDLITRAEQDVNLLIPVVFNLSSWANKRQTIADWLVEELDTRYHINNEIGKDLVSQKQLLPLLDGLDEVKKEYRDRCVVELNQFQKDCCAELVVCSRIQDYEKLSEPLNFQSAICIKLLSIEQICHYLDNVSADLTGLKTLIKRDTGLQELAQSPLMLSIMKRAYEGVAVDDLPRSQVVKEQRKRLFDDYIKKMFERNNRSKGEQIYSEKQARHWLIWLAKKMDQESQADFWIERMQPSLLNQVESSLNATEWIYCIGVMLVVYLVIGLLFCPSIFEIGLKEEFSFLYVLIYMPIALSICGLISSLVSLLTYQTYQRLKTRRNSRRVPRSNSRMSSRYRSITKFRISRLLASGIIGSLITAPIYAGLIVFFVKPSSKYSLISMSLFIYPVFSTLIAFIIETVESEILKIEPVQNLHISSKKIKTNLLVFVILALLFPVVYQIRNLIVWGSLDWNSLGKLMLVLIPLGLFFTIFNGFELPTNISEKPAKPNQGIWDSAKRVLYFMVGVMPTGAIIGFLWATQTQFINEYVAVAHGMALGLIGSILIFGQGSGIACIKHLTLRLILYQNNYIPWNYARFLDYATERIFLQKVGGSYKFIHRMLREHFAQM